MKRQIAVIIPQTDRKAPQTIKILEAKKPQIGDVVLFDLDPRFKQIKDFNYYKEIIKHKKKVVMYYIFPCLTFTKEVIPPLALLGITGYVLYIVVSFLITIIVKLVIAVCIVCLLVLFLSAIASTPTRKTKTHTHTEVTPPRSTVNIVNNVTIKEGVDVNIINNVKIN